MEDFNLNKLGKIDHILLEKAPIGMGISSLDGSIIYANTTMQQLIGYTREELNSIKLASLYVNPQERELLLKIVQEKGSMRDFEVHLKRKDGSVYTASINIELYTLNEQKILITSLQDITQRKASEEKFYKVFHSSSILLAISTIEDGLLIDVNDIFLNTLGFKREEVLGNTTSDLNLWGDVSQRDSIINELKETGKVQNADMNVRKKNGDILFGLFSADVIQVMDKSYLLSMMIDITDRKIAEQKLRESEKKHRNLIDTSVMGILEIDVINRELSYVNPKYLEILGHDREDLVDSSLITKVIHPEDLEKIRELSEFTNLEFRVYTKNGQLKWVSGTRINQYDDEGKLKGFRLWIQDITTQKFMMDELRTYKERYSLASSAGKSGVWDWNIETGEIYIDPIIKAVLGYRDDEIPNNIDAWSTYFHPEGLAYLNKATKAYFDGKMEEFNTEYRMIHKDGSIRWIETQAKALRDSKGKAVRFVGTSTDITERRIFEEALRESENRFHAVISNTPVVLWAIDNDGMITLSEGKGLESLGFKQRETVGQSVFEIYRDYPQIISDIKNALSGENFTTIRQIGSITYETKYQPIRNKEGTIIGVSGLSIDVTERHLAEKLVKEQVQKLSELNKLKTDLLRRTSHELKTPLISIKGYADLLLTLHADKLDDEMISIMEEVKRGSLRLESLVKDLLESSRLDSGKIQLNILKEDLAFLISFCVGELQLLAKNRNHEIILKVHDKLITKFEKEKIYDVVNNLILNAIKYTPPGGRIEVKSEIKDGFYIISVKDNGIGIENDEKSVLFQQFGKIERFGRGWDVEPGGSGLGLFISKKIIELHGGNIWFESDGMNKGSTFYFSLPIINE